MVLIKVNVFLALLAGTALAIPAQKLISTHNTGKVSCLLV